LKGVGGTADGGGWFLQKNSKLKDGWGEGGVRKNTTEAKGV